VTSREPQKAYFNSYSRSTKEFMDSELVNNECLSEYNPTLDRIYAIPIDIMPIDYKVLNVDNGKFVSSYSSTYYDSYPLAENLRYLLTANTCLIVLELYLHAMRM